MADSWEDEAANNQPPKLNPTAASFSFNPGASTFTLPGASNSPEEPPKPVVAPPSKPESTPSPKPAAPEPKTNGAQESPKDAAPESREDSVEATTKQVKKLAVTDEEETDAQKSTREAGVKKALEELNAEDPREHMNVVFIGHVDAGKSTTAGQILFITGGVDDRTIEKYEREAKEKNRESWYMAYIMDTNEEERTKGITVEVGRAYFETPKKRYTILDAPGHKSYVPNMISGASQADVGVLVISARKGEFETGFEKGGQTREHAQLAKTLGVSKLVVVINKMDDPTVAGPNGEWQKGRFDEIEAKLMPFLKGCGYNPKKDLVVLPISGLFGHNMKERVDNKFCDWYNGPSLFEVLDEVDPTNRDPLGAFRMPIMDRYKDMGTIVMGKSESGLVKKGDSLVVMPNKVPVKVMSVYRDETEVNAARPGENLRLRLQGIEEEDISSGFVVSSRYNPVPVVTVFEAQIAVLELLEHKPILTGGYKAILHIHSVVEECEVTKIVAVIDPKTKEKKKAKFVKSGAVLIARIAVEKAICIEPFDKVPQLGRFTLRDEGRTVAIGKVIKLPKSKE